MISTLLGFVGIDVKREVKGLAMTLSLALAGAFLAIVTIAIAMRAFYLWLEAQIGVFPALAICGVGSALLAIVLFFVAFRSRKVKPAPRAANPLQASAAALADATEQAVNDATDSVRSGSRKQMYSTILIAALAGLLLGRRL